MQFKGKRTAGGGEDIFLFDTGLLGASEIYSALSSAGYTIPRAAVTYRTKNGGESTKEIPPAAIPSIKQQHGFDKWSIIVMEAGQQIVIQIIDSEHMMSMRTGNPALMQAVVRRVGPYLKAIENRKIAQRAAGQYGAPAAVLPQGNPYQQARLQVAANPMPQYQPQQVQPEITYNPYIEAMRRRTAQPAAEIPATSSASNPYADVDRDPYAEVDNDPYGEVDEDVREPAPMPAANPNMYPSRQLPGGERHPAPTTQLPVVRNNQPPAQLQPAPQYVPQRQQPEYSRAVSYDYEPERPAQIVERADRNIPVETPQNRRARQEAAKWSQPAKPPIPMFIISLLEGLFLIPLPFTILSITDMVAGRRLVREGNNGEARERFGNIRNNAIIGVVGVVLALALFAWKILPGLI